MTPPPKPPRVPSSSSLPRDRDVRVEKTASPIAVIGQNTERSLKIQQWDAHASTPLGASDYETMAFRAQRASENSKVAVLELAKVREENNQGMLEINDRVDVLAGHLGDVRVELGKLTGAVEILVPLVQQSLSGAMQTQTLTLTAKLEGDKAQQLSEVKVTEAIKLDVVEGRKWRRATVAGLLGSGGLITVLITILAGKC